MTKYILHGGRINKPSPDTDAFYRELTSGTTGKTTVLMNYFSREDEVVPKMFEANTARFLENSENKELVFELAHREHFIEQLGRADILLMVGGESAKLVAALSKYGALEDLFKDKIIGGSSAGVYALSKYYWENDIDEIGEGLGLFEIKAYCHFAHEKKKNVEKLREYKEDLPVLCLPDHKWVVVYK